MSKTGQVTLFVILGLIILIVFGLLMSTSSHINIVKSRNTYDDTTIKQCATDLALEGIYSLALNGGYLYTFYNVTKVGDISIANHRMYSVTTAPSYQLMESDLSRHMLEGLKSCKDVDVSLVKTTIADSQVEFDIVYNGHNYKHIQNSDLGLLIKDAKSLTMKNTTLVATMKNSDSGFSIDTMFYNSETTIFSLKKSDSLVLNFAVIEKRPGQDFLFNLDNRLAFDSKNPETVFDNMKTAYKLAYVGSIAIIKAGDNGGSIEATDKILHLGSSSVKCYIIKDQAVQFSKADVESSIAKYIEESFSTDDSLKGINIKADIQDDEVIIRGDIKGSAFQVKIPAPLGKLLQERDELISNLEKGTTYVGKDDVRLTIQVISSEDMVYRLVKQTEMGAYEFNLGVCND